MSNRLAKESNTTIGGTCINEFEPLRKVFYKSFIEGNQENAQLCIYLGDQCVVDLWGSFKGIEDYGPDSLHNIFSSSKCIESIVIAMLVDKGLLKYDEKVSTYWPEFASNGKCEIKIEDVLRHESGLARFNGYTHEQEDILRDNLKKNSIGSVIEKCSPVFPSPDSCNGSEREYHAATRGFILNEIVRRVDPQMRTIGEIVQEDIGEKDIALGLNDEQIARCTQQYADSYEWGMKYLENSIDKHPNFKIKLTRLQYALKAKNLPKPIFPGLPSYDPSLIHPFFEIDVIRRGEFPSGNVHASARGLAKLASSMANKGKMLDGSSIISQDTWNLMHSNSTLKFDAGLSGNTFFTKGGINEYIEVDKTPANEVILMPSERVGYFGWDGLGGSVMQWHPNLKIGFGYTPSKLHWYHAYSHIGAKLQKAAVDCAMQYNSN